MGAVAAPLMFIGGALGIGGAVMGYANTRDLMKQQNATTLATAGLQQQQYMIQAAMQAQQAAAFASQSGALVRQADAYVMQSQIAAKTGEILQQNEMLRATQAQREADEQSRRAAELRRQMIGEGKVRFAANGVLLEGRPQSAVAMWEQDEVADLAYELSGIKRQVDNEVWGHIFSGSQQRMQGLFDAQAMKLQADASRIEAGTAGANAAAAMAQGRLAQINAQTVMLQAQSSIAANNAATQSALWNMIGSIGGIGMSMGTMAYNRSTVNSGANPGGGGTPATYQGISNTRQNPLVHTYG